MIFFNPLCSLKRYTGGTFIYLPHCCTGLPVQRSESQPRVNLGSGVKSTKVKSFQYDLLKLSIVISVLSCFFKKSLKLDALGM